MHLVEGVGAGLWRRMISSKAGMCSRMVQFTYAPVGEEQAEANGLEHAGNSANSNGVKGSLFRGNLGNNLERDRLREAQ